MLASSSGRGCCPCARRIHSQQASPRLAAAAVAVPFSGCGDRRRRPARGAVAVARGLGEDVVSGWLDIAKLVASDSKAKSPYEELAYKIGRDVYVDIAGWHLFLRDMSAAPGLKMSHALAGQLGPEATGGRLRIKESDVAALLRRIPVELGAGRTRVSLLDCVPSACVGDLVRILEDHARDN